MSNFPNQHRKTLFRTNSNIIYPLYINNKVRFSRTGSLTSNPKKNQNEILDQVQADAVEKYLEQRSTVLFPKRIEKFPLIRKFDISSNKMKKSRIKSADRKIANLIQSDEIEFRKENYIERHTSEGMSTRQLNEELKDSQLLVADRLEDLRKSQNEGFFRKKMNREIYQENYNQNKKESDDMEKTHENETKNEEINYIIKSRPTQDIDFLARPQKGILKNSSKIGINPTLYDSRHNILADLHDISKNRINAVSDSIVVKKIQIDRPLKKTVSFYEPSKSFIPKKSQTSFHLEDSAVLKRLRSLNEKMDDTLNNDLSRKILSYKSKDILSSCIKSVESNIPKKSLSLKNYIFPQNRIQILDKEMSLNKKMKTLYNESIQKRKQSPFLRRSKRVVFYLNEKESFDLLFDKLLKGILRADIIKETMNEFNKGKYYSVLNREKMLFYEQILHKVITQLCRETVTEYTNHQVSFFLNISKNEKICFWFKLFCKKR